MMYKLQEFTYKDDDGIVEILIDPKKGYCRIYATPGSYPNFHLRNLLNEKKWNIRTVALSTKENYINIFLLRGDALLNFLKEPDTHNDSAMHLIPKEWHDIIRNQRNYEKIRIKNLKEELLKPEKEQSAGILAYCKTTGRFLLNKRASNIPAGGQWATFGGRCETLESPQITAIREFEEEAGLIVSENHLIPIWTFENDKMIHFNYLLPLTKEISCNIDKKECDEYAWVSYKNMEKLKLHNGVAELFKNDALLKKIIMADNTGINYHQVIDDLFKDDDDPGPMIA